MSNQIVISSGAKVRALEGVLTGTAGIVNALAINVANGIPQLDGSGKILVSQLPNSVMEYKGSWNAATNTPTLVNGTGNAGDVYLCEVAGTVNFGAGPITFAVGDQVIYSGAIWQRASGATGTVTSVAVTESGDALTITGSPITTSGTINIGFAGNSGQYVNGAGGLTTFPSLTGFVPYTGATANVDLGTFNLTADVITGATGSFASSGGSDTFAINHSSGSGIALNITKGGNGEGLYINKTSGSGNAATIIGTLNATTLVKSGGTSSQFLMADGSVNTSVLPSGAYLPLTGGTLTGPLNGTSATFAGNLNITINTSGDINYLALTDTSWNIGDRKSISWYQGSTKLSSIDSYFEAGLNVGFRFSTYSNANYLQDAFTISPAGAGIFLSTLTANNNISAIRSGSSLTTLGQSRYLNLNDYFGNTNARMEIGFGYSAATGVTNVPAIIGFLQTEATNLSKGDIYFATRDVTTDTAPTVRLTIASTGAATFTGALSGTSATFSGQVDIVKSIPTLLLKEIASRTTGLRGEISWDNSASSTVAAIRATALTDNVGTSLDFYTRPVGGGLTNTFTIASTGNVGIGITPSAWYTGYTALQVGFSGSIFSNRTSSDTNTTMIANNAFLNSAATNWIYQNNGFATRYTQVSGGHEFYTAASGTAGNAITWGTAKLTIASTGAATFSSSVNMGGDLALTPTDSAIIFSSGAGRFFTGGAERMRITSGGRIGISGVTNPTYALSIGSDTVNGIGIQNGSGNTSNIYFSQYSNEALSYTYIRADARSTGYMAFHTNDTERMRITSGGNIEVGNTGFSSPSGADRFIGVYGGQDCSLILQDAVQLWELYVNDDFYINRGSTNVLTALRSNGNVGIGTSSPSYQLQLSTDSAAKPTSALWTIASDERIKENINPYNKGLQELLKINPITYDYNGLGGFTKGKGGVGIIAQEIIDILPDSVSSIKVKLNETDDQETDILNFNGHELIYVLINAIKEQQAQIEELKAMILAKN
jgi:hypothetical protein